MDIKQAFQNVVTACNSINFNISTVESANGLRQSVEVLAKHLQAELDPVAKAVEEVKENVVGQPEGEEHG